MIDNAIVVTQERVQEPKTPAAKEEPNHNKGINIAGVEVLGELGRGAQGAVYRVRYKGKVACAK